IEHGLDLIMIDYMQLMSTHVQGESRQQEISSISRGLKSIAREMQCPVIALSQLSRAPELRSDHRPILSDLRESGAIEQDADLVMFLYRDEYYHEDSDKKNVGELIIAKQRNGETGKIDLAWLGQYTKFASLQRPGE
ncbi:MAG: DnaB-like helicase C-terminal domain-containing protein, partial [Clostridiales bacterium]|nr:DnaB-like helicase C-terminal domain-containing protein [Clostridiales bacterium]